MDFDRDQVRAIVKRIVDEQDCCAGQQIHPAPDSEMARQATLAGVGEDANQSGSRVIITVLGRNAPGIAAGITGIVAEVGGNTLDLSQTLLGEFFAMVIVADFAQATLDYGIIQERLIDRGASLGVRIVAQHEDVFRYMHRI